MMRKLSKAIKTSLLTTLEGSRDSITVIGAGYGGKRLNDFFKIDAGLKSRFNHPHNTIEFEDYSAEELLMITTGMLANRQYTIPEEGQCRQKLENYIKDMIKSGMMENSRGARSLSEVIIKNAETRKLYLGGEIIESDIPKIINPWEDLRPRLPQMREILEKRVKGQTEAVNKVISIVTSAAYPVADPRGPKGKLFFVGPTGVGKTELAKALAESLSGNENAYHRFDMAEFQQEHSAHRLVGAPPSYVGYEGGGQLTNAVMQNPFAVILFDEIEKSHRRIFDIFLSILEDGRLTDGQGQTVDFSNTIIIFTSNIGTNSVNDTGDFEEVKQRFTQSVSDHFRHVLGRPEILGRIGENNIVPFNFMTAELLLEIAKTNFSKIQRYVKEKHKVEINWSDEIIIDIVSTVDTSLGARNLNNTIKVEIEEKISSFIALNSSATRIVVKRTGNNTVIEEV